MERRRFIKETIVTTGSLLILPAFLMPGNSSANGADQLLGVITIDAKQNGVKFDHFWSKCVGAGRANEGLRASWLERLKQAKQY